MDQEAAPAQEVAEIAPKTDDAKERSSAIVVAAEKRTARANQLCERAGRTDILYISALGVLDVGGVIFDSQIAKFHDSFAVRLAGPAFIGLAWGATLGAIPLVVPQCEWPGTPRVLGPEASRHSELPLMLSLAVFAGATAPFVVGLEQGPVPKYWPVPERSARLIAAGVGGALGALIPYLLPPKPFRAIRELRNLDVSLGATDLTVRLTF